jgi:hypothetical protein
MRMKITRNNPHLKISVNQRKRKWGCLLYLKKLHARFSSETSQETIEKARRYPIFEITKYRLALQSCGNKSSSPCPFHKEKYASFYIYHETNTFYCLRCQESGDVIKLTMHLYSVSFKEAVQMLQ